MRMVTARRPTIVDGSAPVLKRDNHYVEPDMAEIDPNVVLGLFTWSENPPLLIERSISRSRAGPSRGNRNGQCVVHPWEAPGNVTRFDAPRVLNRVTYSFTWTPTSVVCEIATQSGGDNTRAASSTGEGQKCKDWS